MTHEKLVKLSPYPVTVEYMTNYYGWFEWGDGTDRFSHPYAKPYNNVHIALNDKLTGAKRNAVLIHEIGHTKHYKRHCKCCTPIKLVGMRFSI